ncbi:MAG TPA: three-Cys-motif partner protein TcmP [Chthonomonadaceae bacterium]|nr:three-Cys-motif partner protein TcmP [Chthonomonadaceae bacterium]
MPRHTKSFWEYAADWSRRKHLILRYYLTPAAPKLGTQGTGRRVYVIDGFAGRGLYSDNTKGSPLLLAELAEECRRWRSPVELIIHNAEPDADNFAALQDSTSHWSGLGYVKNHQITFQELLPGVLRQAGSSPVFAFLDPFRPSDLTFQDVVPLIQRSAATEVLIVFHTPLVIRLLEAVRPTARTPDKSKAKLAALLDRVFGGSSWEGLMTSDQIDPATVATCLSNQVRAQSRWNTFYVCPHAIDARYNVGLKYHVILLTRHSDGVELMNDAFCKEALEVYSQSTRQSNGQLELGIEVDTPAGQPVVELTMLQRHRDLCASLMAIGRKHAGRIWKRGDLICESIVNRFGDFTKTEHRQAIQSLVDIVGDPPLTPLDGRKSKKGKWVINDSTRLQFR